MAIINQWQVLIWPQRQLGGLETGEQLCELPGLLLTEGNMLST